MQGNRAEPRLHACTYKMLKHLIKLWVRTQMVKMMASTRQMPANTQPGMAYFI